MIHVVITVQGHIDTTWSEWLNSMTIKHAAENESILTGTVVDQSALYGLLSKLRDMGLTLVSVASANAPAETPISEELINNNDRSLGDNQP